MTRSRAWNGCSTTSGRFSGAADPALVTPQMLNGIQEPLQQISSLIPPLRDNREFAHLQTIEATTEGVLNAAVQVAPALGVWSKSNLSKAASSLGEAATAKNRELQNRVAQLEGRLGEISEEMEQASASHATDLRGATQCPSGAGGGDRE